LRAFKSGDPSPPKGAVNRPTPVFMDQSSLKAFPGSGRQRSIVATVLLTLFLASQITRGQLFVSVGIAPYSGNGVKITWTAIPGRTYDVFTSEELGQPWVTTNAAPVRARSTIGTLTDITDATNTPARFYKIKERAVPAGN
jgi:hypothetical protein